jgi:hypothetical protein
MRPNEFMRFIVSGEFLPATVINFLVKYMPSRLKMFLHFRRYNLTMKDLNRPDMIGFERAYLKSTR